jgi:hypothetical protein
LSRKQALIHLETNLYEYVERLNDRGGAPGRSNVINLIIAEHKAKDEFEQMRLKLEKINKDVEQLTKDNNALIIRNRELIDKCAKLAVIREG